MERLARLHLRTFGDPKVHLERAFSIAEGAAANVSRLDFGVHTGTHVDAPLHFNPATTANGVVYTTNTSGIMTAHDARTGMLVLAYLGRQIGLGLSSNPQTEDQDLATRLLMLSGAGLGLLTMRERVQNRQ